MNDSDILGYIEGHFGPEFIFWFDDYSKSRAFKLLWGKVKHSVDARAALLITLGTAYTKGAIAPPPAILEGPALSL